MTGQATLDFLARLSRKAVERNYRGELIERLELSSSDLRRRIREYSTGMKRKLGLIQAFQSDPPLLILDEPTEGLDPLMQEAFYQLLSDAKKRGRTVFMSSHVLSEVERVCDRLAVLRQGDVVLLSEVEAVRRLAARRVRVYFAADCELRPGQLPPQHEIIEVEPRRWSLRVFGPLSPLLKVLRDLPVDDLQVEEPHLEEVLKTYYREGSQ